ncbi:MAG: hypothetical protein ACRD4X_16285 [Candidatus Acidiferrales bacterium]
MGGLSAIDQKLSREYRSEMLRRLAKRRTAAVAILLVFAVSALSTVKVAHSHVDGKEHANCELCHLQHTGVPQPSAPVHVVVALRVVRCISEEQRPAIVNSTFIQSVPRGPPA